VIPVISVEHPIGTVTGQHFDEIGLQVKADRLVEPFIDDDANILEVLFRGCFEVLTQSACGVERFPNVDVPQFVRIGLCGITAVVQYIHDRPVAMFLVVELPRCNGSFGEFKPRHFRVHHTFCCFHGPCQRDTSCA